MERDFRPGTHIEDLINSLQFSLAKNLNIKTNTNANTNANTNGIADEHANVATKVELELDMDVDLDTDVDMDMDVDVDMDVEMPTCSYQHRTVCFQNSPQCSDYISSNDKTYDLIDNNNNNDDDDEDNDNDIDDSDDYNVETQIINKYKNAQREEKEEETCAHSNEPFVDLQYQQFLIGGNRPFHELNKKKQQQQHKQKQIQIQKQKKQEQVRQMSKTMKYEKQQQIQQQKQLNKCNSAMILYDFSCNGILCDAVIIVEDALFTVHTPIMCTCSSYFEATFAGGLNLRQDSPKLIGKKQEVFIPHVTGAIMDELIKYAYLRKATITNDNVYEMLVMSDYFGIFGMMQRCKDFLINNLTPENCIGAMMFANFRLMNDLYNRARSYVMRYFSQVMIKNKDILQLELDEFYSIISDDNLNIRDEDLVWRMCLKWIAYDVNKRRQHVAYLMGGVRLGLMSAKCFMEEVKDHPLVLVCDEAKPLIVEAFKFMYDLDIVNSTNVPLSTPALAMPRLPHEVIFAIGGWSRGTATGRIETYDTRSDRWVVLPRDPDCIPRAYHGSAVIGYKIYCIGGYDGIDCFSKCHVFDLENNKWSEIAPMYYRRCYVSVTVLNDHIYAVGGYDGCHRLNTCEKYNPKTNQWTKIKSLLANRSDGGCCTLNDRIYVVGGFNGQECLYSAEMYNPILNQWTKLPNMSQRRSGVSCVAFRGCVYVVGGFNGTARLTCAEKYDPEFGLWTPICDMSHPRSNFGLEIIDDMIFAVGGFDGFSTISHTECYVPETNEWMEATNLNYVRSALTVTNVDGLPKRLDYVYKERHRLVEERKQRLIANTIRRAVQVTITRQLVMNQTEQNQNNNNNNNNQNHSQNHSQNQNLNLILNSNLNLNLNQAQIMPQFVIPNESAASIAAAALTDPSILANAHQSQDDEVRDIAVSLFQQNHRINFQLQDDMLLHDRCNRR